MILNKAPTATSKLDRVLGDNTYPIDGLGGGGDGERWAAYVGCCFGPRSAGQGVPPPFPSYRLTC